MASIICIDQEKVEKDILAFIKEYVEYIYTPNYLAASETRRWEEKYLELFNSMKALGNLKSVKKQVDISAEKIDFFMNKMESLEIEIENHNDKYIEMQMDLEKLYLDDILKSVDSHIQLDDEQRKVVLDDADAALVVAGAGAGKTTTMAAKVKYLVEKQQVNPEEIIVISFTNKAVNELKERIQKQLGIPAKVTTFHAFGNEIIRSTTEAECCSLHQD